MLPDNRLDAATPAGPSDLTMRSADLGKAWEIRGCTEVYRLVDAVSGRTGNIAVKYGEFALFCRGYVSREDFSMI